MKKVYEDMQLVYTLDKEGETNCKYERCVSLCDNTKFEQKIPQCGAPEKLYKIGNMRPSSIQCCSHTEAQVF